MKWTRWQRWLVVWRRFNCETLGSHYAPTSGMGFDGATVNGRCPHCGRRVGQDSQGNWFSFARQDSGVRPDAGPPG